MKKFLKILISTMFTIGYALIVISLSNSGRNEDALLFGMALGLFIVPILWLFAKKLSERILSDNHHTMAAKLQKELDIKRKTSELKSKIHAQDNMENLYNEVNKRMNKK